MPEKHQVMGIMTFKFHLFVGVAIFLLFSCISVCAQSPNETISLQTEDISMKNRIKIKDYFRVGFFGGETEIPNYYGKRVLIEVDTKNHRCHFKEKTMIMKNKRKLVLNNNTIKFKLSPSESYFTTSTLKQGK